MYFQEKTAVGCLEFHEFERNYSRLVVLQHQDDNGEWNIVEFAEKEPDFVPSDMSTKVPTFISNDQTPPKETPESTPAATPDPECQMPLVLEMTGSPMGSYVRLGLLNPGEYHFYEDIAKYNLPQDSSVERKELCLDEHKCVWMSNFRPNHLKITYKGNMVYDQYVNNNNQRLSFGCQD